MRAAVHCAVEELLIESSPEALTMPVIAARAGVHPTTVYRRWGTLGELLASVAASRFSGDIVASSRTRAHSVAISRRGWATWPRI